MNWAKVIISLPLVYHLMVIFVVPNSTSIVARVAWPWVAPYASQIGVNTSWQFFSPIPTPAAYLRYTVIGNQTMDSGDPELERYHYFPPNGPEPSLGVNSSRLLTAMRFFAAQPDRLRHVLTPYLCRQHPGAQQLQFQHILEVQPQLSTSKIPNSYAQLVEKMKLGDMSVGCPHTEDETDGGWSE